MSKGKEVRAVTGLALGLFCLKFMLAICAAFSPWRRLVLCVCVYNIVWKDQRRTDVASLDHRLLLSLNQRRY